MVPSMWQIVDALPRTANGKVDRNTLTTMARPRPATTGYVAPPQGRAATIVRLWSEVLGLDQVGTHDNFFDLGGDSRSVAALVVRLNDAFHTRMRVVDFMSAPTVTKICEWLDHATTLPGDGPARPGHGRDLRDHVTQRAASRTSALDVLDHAPNLQHQPPDLRRCYGQGTRSCQRVAAGGPIYLHDLRFPLD